MFFNCCSFFLMHDSCCHGNEMSVYFDSSNFISYFFRYSNMISFACICDENLYFEIQPLIRNDSLVYVQPFFFCIFVKPFFCSFFWLFHFILPQILGRLLLSGPCGEMNETFVLKSILISIFVASQAF